DIQLGSFGQQRSVLSQQRQVDVSSGWGCGGKLVVDASTSGQLENEFAQTRVLSLPVIAPSASQLLTPASAVWTVQARMPTPWRSRRDLGSISSRSCRRAWRGRVRDSPPTNRDRRRFL